MPLPAVFWRKIAPAEGRLSFIDREVTQLSQLCDRVLARVHKPEVTDSLLCLFGEPGIGKSRIVAELSRDHEIIHALPDGLLWGDVSNVSNCETRHWKDAIADLLVETSQKRCLVVLDGVSNASVIESALASICSPSSVVVATTRLPGVAGSFPRCPPVQVDGLSDMEAMKLLTSSELLTDPSDRNPQVTATAILKEHPCASASCCRSVKVIRSPSNSSRCNSTTLLLLRKLSPGWKGSQRTPGSSNPCGKETTCRSGCTT